MATRSTRQPPRSKSTVHQQDFRGTKHTIRLRNQRLLGLFNLCESDRLLAILFRDDPFRNDLGIFLADLVVKVLRHIVVVGQDDLFLATGVLDPDRHLTCVDDLQFTFRADGFPGDFDVPRVERRLESGQEGENERCDCFHGFRDEVA
jgi:hypothetical protein